MSGLAVTKMHGALNDFLIVDERRSAIADLPALARRLCNRRSSFGADGLIAISESRNADVRMRILNADGSEAEMCGNGIRCVARYLSERDEGDDLRVETIAGIVDTSVVEKGEAYSVRVAMGVPRLERRALPFSNAQYVSMGNPHVVLFVDAVDDVDLAGAARTLEAGGQFPDGTNVHAATVVHRHRLDVRHYERGVGPTYACGTGAVASAAAAIARGVASSPVEVYVPGGVLTVEWEGDGPSFLTGPAARVYEAQVDVEFAHAR
jgi:diaminopimelate epimerase